MIHGMTEQQLHHHLVNTALRTGIPFGEASEKAGIVIAALKDDDTPEEIKQVFANMIEITTSGEDKETAMQKFVVKTTPLISGMLSDEKRDQMIALSAKCRRSLKIKSIIKTISF